MWPWRLRRAIDPWPVVSRAMELETAKEILEEVLHARPGEVEEIIQKAGGERACGAREMAVVGDVPLLEDESKRFYF
jgi:hypothetical protein